METTFRKEFLVDSRSVDMFDQCHPSALLGFLQEAATGAVVQLGISSYDAMEKYHAIWMLARTGYWLERPLHWDERITVETWHRGGKGASTYRDYDIFDAGGTRIGEATSIWVLADADTFQLLRVGDMKEFDGTDGGKKCKKLKLTKLHMPDGMKLEERRLLRYSETDINSHINNTHYADYAADALHLERLEKGNYISSLRIGFLSQCQPGERVDLYTAWDGACGYVHGTDLGGKERFDAAITLKNAPLQASETV